MYVYDIYTYMCMHIVLYAIKFKCKYVYIYIYDYVCIFMAIIYVDNVNSNVLYD